MAKFTDKQVLELFRDELARRLKCDQDYLPSQNDHEFCLIIKSRINLFQDLIATLEFYSNYEFD